MSKTKHISKITAPLILLATFFVISIIVFWPGVMCSDSITQYHQAIAGNYSDHHPPLMGFVWRYLDILYTGPGLMWLLPLMMLYGACAIFIYIFRNNKFKWWYAILPIIPWILAYTPLIVKDVSFAFSYLLAGAIMAYLMTDKVRKYKWTLLSFVFLLLFYGTAVKYQARFLLIFFTIGAAFCAWNYKYSWKMLLTGFGMYLLILQAMFSFNNWLVPQTRVSHAWQYVKLYDLSAISIYTNQPLFPEFVIENPNFSFARVKSTFTPHQVDALAFSNDAVLRTGHTEQERNALLSYWRTTIMHHPWLYLKARVRLLSYSIAGTPSALSNPAKFLETIPMLKPIVSQPAIYSSIGSIYSAIKATLEFTWLLPLLIIYTYLSVIRLKSSSYALPLLMFSVTSLMLLGVMLFMSMAGTARYLFLCVCLVHASHGFAYRCLTNPKP